MDHTSRVDIKHATKNLIQYIANMIDLKKLGTGNHLIEICYHIIHYDISTRERAEQHVHCFIRIKVGRWKYILQTHNKGTIKMTKNIDFAKDPFCVLIIHK